jgi:hypothetical protein
MNKSDRAVVDAVAFLVFIVLMSFAIAYTKHAGAQWAMFAAIWGMYFLKAWR